jgi:RHS repeat-associated protein
MGSGVGVEASCAYNGLGDRLSETANGQTTHYTMDLNAGLTQVLQDGTNTYLYGMGRIAQYKANNPEFYLTDALGSVRQLVDANGNITLAKDYNPYGEVLSSTGSGTTSYGFTGEWTDASTGDIYLRARWYVPGQGRFLTKDTWEGNFARPMSRNGWNYGYSNPVKYSDPSGYNPGCPIGDWNCEAVRNVWKLKNAFQESASRHSLIPGMDSNGFTALLASIVVAEQRIGNVPPIDNERNRLSLYLEDGAAGIGYLVSGHTLLDTLEKGHLSQFWRYLTNQDIPQLGLATVGIGNVWLYTASNIWHGQACSPALGGECTPVEINKLQINNIFGKTVDITNPFGPLVVCANGMGGECTIKSNPTEIESLVYLEHQLLLNKTNIEYIAADLEAGARRANAKGWRPTAFNSASWHLWGVQSDEEINRAHWNPGGAIWILNHMSNALEALEISTTWNLQMDPQYIQWK